MAGSPVKVLYIIGWGASGSTLLDNMLGSVNGFFSTGELHALWEGLASDDLVCGCEEPIRRCPVWSGVIEAGFGGSMPRARAESIVRSQRRVAKMRHFPELIVRSRSPHPERWPALATYAEIAQRLYRSIVDVTGARVVVDSSKLPSYGYLLGRLPEVVPFYVHVVRDPRAVAFSWMRRESRGPVDSTVRWDVWNVAAEYVRRSSSGRSILVRYEDLIERPRPTLESITELVGSSADGVRFEDETTVELTRNHTVSGNQSRFRTGNVELQLDEAWRAGLSARQRTIATVLASPLLARYRYDVATGRPRAEERVAPVGR